MPVEDDIIPVGKNLLRGNWGKIDRIDKGQFKIQVKKARLMEIDEIVKRIGTKLIWGMVQKLFEDWSKIQIDENDSNLARVSLSCGLEQGRRQQGWRRKNIFKNSL